MLDKMAIQLDVTCRQSIRSFFPRTNFSRGTTSLTLVECSEQSGALFLIATLIMQIECWTALTTSFLSLCGVSKSYVHFGEESEDHERQADKINVDAETTKMSTSSTSALDENSDATAMQRDHIQQTQLPVLPSNNTDTQSPLPSVPTGYFFKGYLAWCLWGHIPVAPQNALTSSLFTDAKVDASFQRRAGSRAALKSSADSVTTKNAK
jgi:hypothetical protein